MGKAPQPWNEHFYSQNIIKLGFCQENTAVKINKLTVYFNFLPESVFSLSSGFFGMFSDDLDVFPLGVHLISLSIGMPSWCVGAN